MKRIVGVFCLLYFLFFGFLGFQKSQILQCSDDLPMYLQALWTTLHGHPFHTSWHHVGGPGNSLLGMHFELTLLLFLPLYALWQDPAAFQLAQTLLVALAAFPVYSAANYLFKKPVVSLCFALGLLANPFLQRSLFYDFHPESLQFLSLVCAASFLIQRQYSRFFIAAIFAALTKEDSLIQIFFLGLYAFLFQKERKVGAWTMACSLILFLVFSSIVIPFFRGEPYNAFSGRYPALGNDLPGMLKTILFKPKALFDVIWDPVNLETQLLILLPFAFLPLCSPVSILLISPAMALTCLTQFYPLKTLSILYAFSILPFYPFAAMLGLSRVCSYFSEGKRPKCQTIVGLSLIALSLHSMFFYPRTLLKNENTYQAYYINRFPLSRGFSWDHFLQGDHVKIGRRFIRQNIPPGVPLSTEYRFAAHVTNRFVLKTLVDQGPEEWVFFDLYGLPYLDTESTHFKRFLERKDYGVIAFEDGYTLLRRGADSNKNEAILKLIENRFEAENLPRFTGINTLDHNASRGVARLGRAGVDPQGYLIYGPYLFLESGNYEVRFILKAKEVIKEKYRGKEIAALEVYNRSTQKVIQQKTLFVKDFEKLGKYQPMPLEIHLIQPAKRIEFRIAFYSRANFWVDRVELTKAP